MKKLVCLLIISVLFSSCSSLFYSNRRSNNTFTINSNVQNFEVRFPNARNETYKANNGSFSYTLPKLNSKYTTVDIVSRDYEAQRITLKKTVRIGPLLLDLLSFPLTFGIPVLVDIFRSDFYKISNDSKTNSVTLVYTQSYMSSQFNKIKGAKNPEVFDRFIADYPFFAKNELAINLRDSLEFKFALESYKEQNITKFIQKRPTSTYISRATKIESDFIKSREEFSNVKTKNTVEAYENFIKDFPDAIQFADAHKLLVEAAEKEALNYTGSSKKIIFLNNYLIPNKKFINNTDYLTKKAAFVSKILGVLETEFANKDYSSFKTVYANFNLISKENIDLADLSSFLNVIQKQLSETLFLELLKNKSLQDQLAFENKIHSDFPNLYRSLNLVLNVLEKANDKKGKLEIYNSDYLNLEFNSKNSVSKYKNMPSLSFEYKGQLIKLNSQPTKQILNFSQNVLQGGQESYLSNDLLFKFTVKDFVINGEDLYAKNKLIGTNYFDNIGGFLYKYEYENGVNLTLSSLDEEIKKNDNLVSYNNLEEAQAGYQSLLNNKYPKDLKQNVLLSKKVESCNKLLEKKQLEENRIRIAEEKRREKIRLAEEKKQESLRIAEERNFEKTRAEGKVLNIKNASKQLVMRAIAGEYEKSGYRSRSSIVFDKNGGFKMLYTYDKPDEYSKLIGATIPGLYYKRIVNGSYTLYEANEERFNNIGNVQPTNKYGEPVKDVLFTKYNIVLKGQDDRGQYHTMCGSISQKFDDKYMYGWTISYTSQVSGCDCSCETGDAKNREITIPYIELR
jgi:hypothetical protein